ncbi:MAG: phage tail protein [Proteobacteria bacterium]|nr:phage tail protein [Pseudomonadota bacterium]
MATHTRLLPQNATPIMLASAEANDPLSRLAGEYDTITAAWRNTPPDFMPFLVWQYGLGELSSYLPNLYDLVPQGLRWQRVRGTPAAIAMGLSWVGYAATLHEDSPRRRKWNRFQIELDRIRDADLPDLRRIDGIVSLSPPLRSKFYRGFRGYDVRAAVTSFSRTSGTMLSSHSGVRIEAGKAKWSFGRAWSGDALLGQPELAALGTWIPPVSESELWADADSRWESADFPWGIPAAISRRNTIANALSAKAVYIRFDAADGSVIGFRRAVIHPARRDVLGEYLIGADRWKAYPDDPTAVVVQARTGFGDGAGATAARVSVVFNPVLSPGVSPGKLWLAASEAGAGVSVAQTNLTIPFGLTVRELCRFTLRF